MRKPTDTGNRCFDQFWAAYPRKVGKENARRAFEKIQPSETEFVVHSAFIKSAIASIVDLSLSTS